MYDTLSNMRGNQCMCEGTYPQHLLTEKHYYRRSFSIPTFISAFSWLKEQLQFHKGPMNQRSAISLFVFFYSDIFNMLMLLAWTTSLANDKDLLVNVIFQPYRDFRYTN